MSVIKTWKCDGCGRITREKPDWYVVTIGARNPPQRSFLERPEVVHCDVCSMECVPTALDAAQEKINALEFAS